MRTVGNYNNFKTTFREDATILYVYSNSKKYINNYWDSGDSVKDHEEYMEANRDRYIENLMILNPDSKGSRYREKDIRKVLSHIEQGSEGIYEVTKVEWKSAYNNKDLIGANPIIGMTEEQVIISSWGKPEKINRTTTANGTYDQWVYPNYKYIYLDNGIVTAIQE